MTRFFRNNGSLLLGIILHLFLQATTAFPAGINASSIAAAPGEIYSQATVDSEIHCYGLPFGAFGFTSHILTYYTAVCIAYSRRPLNPRYRSEPGGSWNRCLAAVQFIVSNAMAIITMVDCRSKWQFVLIGVWHSVLSSTLGFMSMHRISLLSYDNRDYTALMWYILYAVGVVIGLVTLVGVISIVERTWEIQGVRVVTYVFVAFVAACSLVFVAVVLYIDSNDYLAIVVLLPVILVLVMGCTAAWYSDWVLGVTSGNLGGAPGRGSRKVLSVIYFLAKRLPMLIW